MDRRFFVKSGALALLALGRFNRRQAILAGLMTPGAVVAIVALLDTMAPASSNGAAGPLAARASTPPEGGPGSAPVAPTGMHVCSAPTTTASIRPLIRFMGSPFITSASAFVASDNL